MILAKWSEHEPLAKPCKNQHCTNAIKELPKLCATSDRLSERQGHGVALALELFVEDRLPRMQAF